MGDDLYLYLAVSPHSVSSVLVRQEGREHMPIYYTSKTLLSAETRYLPLEKLAFALVIAARKLQPYFQAHKIVVLTEYPLKTLLRKADLSNRISKWAVELGNLHIVFQPRMAIKAQVLADFVAEFTPAEEVENYLEDSNGRARKDEAPWRMLHGDIWKLFVDGASNYKGSGAGIVLIAPCGTTHEHALKLNFSASNNEAEYEALIAGLKIANGLSVEELDV